MIRVLAEPQAILRRMGDQAANWLTRARLLTSELERAGRYVKLDAIWSEIKADLVELQHVKCAYCERILGSAGVEWSVDHFRPKGAVRYRDRLPGGVRDVGGASTVGYYLLAYDLGNLVATCLPCNTFHKSNYFPTAQPRRLNSTDPAQLVAEQPYLVNPVDHGDDDPEALIAWRGPVPTAAADGGFARDRALVTIDVLGLATREELVRERVLVLIGVWLAYRAGDQRALDRLCQPTGLHAACAREFRRLCELDPDVAKTEYELIQDLLSPPN